ncbi:uncharacterized protein FIESC28_08274 [Fusarium coffeatum]|uniref:Apple domain-containing protein n=1 Tax=Fusarium coffeatum TaxID=231269 RepID=A0A366R9S5_9HYPO|nr:uncharacterized protein FIESC28_08274 [Fusarium coffeatum]RBR13308.1 hypothetical protein FIESC28_08274 [Fusarium coffeatum]
MVAFKSLIVLLALGVKALAGPVKPESLLCTTFLSTKTVKTVPTATTSVVENKTIIKKIFRRVNVIVVPRPVTTTARTTKTDTITFTDDSEIATVTITSDFSLADKSTKTNYRTSWVTRSSMTSTTTTKSFTSTVTTTPVAFTAILDNTKYVARRDLPLGSVTADYVSPVLPVSPLDGQLPQSVRCVKAVPKYTTKVVTTQVQGPRRTLKAVTKTSTLTSSTSVVSTFYPEATSTSYTTEYHEVVTTDVDVTSTTVVSETVTVESWIPQATFYNICSSRNMMRSANGGSVITYTDAGGVNFAEFGKGFTEVSCCNACAADPYRRGTTYRASDTNCFAYISRDKSVCGTSRNLLARYITLRPSTDKSVYSNGPCGYWENGGEYARPQAA